MLRLVARELISHKPVHLSWRLNKVRINLCKVIWGLVLISVTLYTSELCIINFLFTGSNLVTELKRIVNQQSQEKATVKCV